MALRWRIGVDLGGTKIAAAALDPLGRVRHRARVPAPRHDYPGTLSAISGLVGALEEKLGEKALVGVGIPGALSLATGLVKNANSTWLIGKPFDRDLSRLLARPVRVANDANCFALSEAVDGAGAGAGARVVFGVILGTGCGGGLVISGQVHVGRNAIAGEWGHNPLPWPRDAERPGPTCYCGKRGCIETWLSGPGFSAAHEAGERRAARARGDRRARLGRRGRGARKRRSLCGSPGARACLCHQRSRPGRDCSRRGSFQPRFSL